MITLPVAATAAPLPGVPQTDLSDDEPSSCEAFESVPSLTLGVEEELLLLEPVTLTPVNEVEHVLARLEGDARFACEFRAAQIELITPVVPTVPDVRHELAAARAFAVERAAGAVRFAAAGTDPLSTEPVVITPGDRYARMAAEYPWASWRGLPSGLHVHVALGDAGRALAVFNAARSYLPEIGALAANSPFFEGRDTGLASTRMRLNEDLPRSGTPPSFASWDAFAEYLAWGAAGTVIPDASHVWWDLRPNLRYGTLEFRVADAQTRIADTGAVAAVCQSLVAALAARYDAGEPLPVHDTLRIAENRVRALRHGIHGSVVDLDDGTPVPTAEKIASMLFEIEPFAEQLGCRDDFLHAFSMLRENGADRQRIVVREQGLGALSGWLADQTEASSRRGTRLAGSAERRRTRVRNGLGALAPVSRILSTASGWTGRRRCSVAPPASAAPATPR